MDGEVSSSLEEGGGGAGGGGGVPILCLVYIFKMI